MKLRTMILVRVGLLILLMTLALSATFLSIFAGDVKQRSQQAVEAAFSLLEDSLHRQQREMAREAEKVNAPIRMALDQLETVRQVTLPPQPNARLAYLQKVMARTTPLADQLYTLADALGRDDMRIALYDRRGCLVMLYTAVDSSSQTVYLYLPELQPDTLLLQRQKTLFVGASATRTILAEKRINRLADPAAIETVPLPPGLSLTLPAATITGTADERFSRLGNRVALQYRAPVHGMLPGYDYFVPTGNIDPTEPNNGLIELTLRLQAGDIQQIAAMTHTEINTFTDDRLACGTLPTYIGFEGTKTEVVGFSAFVGNPPVRQVVARKLGNESYYESRMMIGNGNTAVGTVAVLLSRQAEKDAATVLSFSISAAVAVFGFIAAVVILRFSNRLARPVNRLVSSIQQLARGESVTGQTASREPESASFSEVQQINSALDDLLKSNEETVKLAEAIAAGDLTVQVVPRSGQDRLMLSLNRMVQQLNEHHARTMRAMQEAEIANRILAETNEKLEVLSTTDALTGIANRRQLDAVLANEITRHARNGTELALILLDIDHFKKFNDLYGHLQGDETLCRLAGALEGCLNRPGDLAARYGGEEFACILPETGRAGALLIAERMRQAIIALNIPHAGSQVKGIVTASFGVVAVRCSAAVTAADLLDQADKQLYQAKAEGRNLVMAA